MDYIVIILSACLVLSQGFNLKTRQLCCNLGTKYSSDGQSCKRFQQSPIPDIGPDDEKACLSTIDFCCKKQLRVLQCEEGKNDARSGSCPLADGDNKDCCEACQMGIETKRAGDPCEDTLGFGSPYSEAFISCCEEANDTKTNNAVVMATTTSTAKLPNGITDSLTSAEGAKYLKPNEELALYPGLSEENVCETGEFCAQLCEHTGGKTFKCACFPGYQLMKDGISCKPIKSAKGSRCEKNNPCDHDCSDTGTSIECSCRKGYDLAADKKSCKDIDECALGLHQCEAGEECENDEGTYFCFVTVEEDTGIGNKCPTGQKFNAEKSVCDDIDECEIDLICPPPKVCKNSIGSFSCEGPDCPPGFYYKSSIESCADIDECTSGTDNCNKDTEICLNTKGHYTCVDKASRKGCPPGFKKNDVTFRCEDINECEENIQVCLKDELCFNEEGGYKCLKIDKITSQINKNNINFNNQYTTPKVQAPPSCPSGFRFNRTQNTCDDINECQLRMDNCSPQHRCDNTVGSFSCTRTVSCGTGYTLNTANDLCEDDDECQLGTHNCYGLGQNYKCKNLLGTYRCEYVRPIYTPSSTPSTTSTTTTTEHTSEATTASTTSTQTQSTTHSSTSTSTQSITYPTTTIRPPIPITNVWGEPFYSYNRNRPWWTYATTPKTTASRYTYPITTQPSSTGFSSNRFSQPYQRPVSAVTARYTYPITTIPSSTSPVLNFSPPKTNQFNPYTNSPHVPFSSKPRRLNDLPIINGMLKKCLPGYRMNDKGDCEDINECESNPCPRGLKCLNFNGRYECSSPLYCKIGYEPNEAGDECIDINECAKGIHNCSKTQICKNGLGYYTCECPPGHHLNRLSQTCEDIDECKFYMPCGDYADCMNTVGSYQCGCKPGFRKNQSFCDDINECRETPGLCEHSCINVWGSFRCACKVGFKLNSDNRTCTDIDECEKFKDRKLCIGKCVNVPGSYACECPKGYKLGNDKRVCIDIDECQHNVCAPQDACVNTRGGFKCFPITCAANYVKDPNHKARCKRLTCDPRDNQCLLMPEQYSYQYMALVSNLPLSEGGIPLYKIKGPDWTAARADYSLKLIEVNCPPGIEKVDESFIRKVHHENNLMELNLVRSIQGPQEVKLEVKMELFHGNNLIGSVVVYIVIVVSEYPF